MASNHVHMDGSPLPGGHNNAFAEHDLNGFNAPVFAGGADQAFDNWNLDPNQLANQRSHSSQSLPQAWQTSGPVQRPLSALNTGFDVDSNFYGRTFSNSPAPYQNAPFVSHGGLHNYHNASLDPALVSGSSIAHSNFSLPVSNYQSSAPQAGTIAPQALQSNGVLPSGSNRTPSADQVPVRAGGNQQSYGQIQSPSGGPPLTPGVRSELLEAPKGKVSGNFIVVDFDELSKATKSHRLHNFVNIGDIPIDLPINKTTVPQYVARKSRHELTVLAAGDKKLLDKISKAKKIKTTERKRNRPHKPASAVRRTSAEPKEEPSSSETETSDDDSDYDSDDSEEGSPEPSPLPTSRPQEPIQAVRYDTIKAVWLPRKLPAQAEQIRSGLGDFWEVVRTIRDRWKTDTQAVKQAEEAKKTGELPLLRDRVKNQRDMMEMALRAAVEHGHPDILALFGKNQPLLFLLYQFVADRAREKEYDVPISKAAVELLSRCTTLDHDTLEKTKLDKILNLLVKKGGDEIRENSKQILAKAAVATKSKADSPASDQTKVEKSTDLKKDEATPQPVLARRPAPELSAGIKRPRVGEATAGQPAKRVASGSAAPASTAAKPLTMTMKRPGSTTAEKAPTTNVAAAKPKVQPVVAKSTSFFSSLQSASKKPGTSNAVAAKTGTLQKKTPASATATAPPKKPAFSFAETMANLTKPKEPEPVVKEEPKLPPETEEERAKRLRKEERRKLRVTFKPDAALLEIRYFTHDPEEELGHDASMVRDAGDVGGEGRMFKQHKDMELDEDDDLPREESYNEWREPTLVDFTVVPEDERNRNYAPYGGGVNQPVSPDKGEQERREATTLMVFYTHPSDIPPSPREPPEAAVEEAPTVMEFGLPEERVLHRAAAFQPLAAPNIDISAILNIIGGQPQQTQPAQPQAPASDLEKIFANFSQPAQPAPQPVAQPQMVAPMQQQQQPPPIPDISAILGALQQQGTIQPQPQPQPQPQQMPQFTQGFPAMSGTPDLGAIFASLSQQGISMPQMPGFGFQNPNPQQQQQQAPYENPDRKRFRDGDDGNSGNHDFKRSKSKKNNPNFKTIPCRFYKEGKCRKGDDCGYIHDNN